MPRDAPPQPEDRRSLAALALFAAAALATYLRGHVDDNDSSLYVLLGESLLRDHDPFRILAPPWNFARAPFYEHPPLWFAAVAGARAVGLDPNALGAACGLGVVLLTWRVGVALVGARAALLGATLLAVTPRFVSYQPSARLDQPLVLAFTASVTLLVLARGRAGMLLAGGLVAGVGVLVKGPPALGAPLAAVLVLAFTGRGEDLRRPRAWLLAGAGALLPAAAFLAWDHVALGGAWWAGYVDQQVLASLDGRRSDHRGHLAVLASVVRWFRPGWPLAVVALARPFARRWPVPPESRRARWALLAWAALVIGAYSAASREYAWYAFPAYPALALLGGVAIEDLVARWDRGGLARGVRRALVVAGAVLVALLPFRIVRAVQPPCMFGAIPAEARALARTGAVVLAGGGGAYLGHVVLSVHCGCEIVRVDDLAPAARRPDVAAVVLEHGVPAPEGDWSVAAETPRWRLLTRSGAAR